MSTQDVWRCDSCCKPMEEHHRYCKTCLKAIAEREAPRACRFCDGKQTVHATYQMESDYGAPYICHTCMKDQRDGYVWKEIPEHIVYAVIERGDEALLQDEPALVDCPYCHGAHYTGQRCPLNPHRM